MVQFEIMKRACTDTLSMTGLRSHWRSSGERIVPPSQQMKRGMTASCSSCISISPIASQALGVGGDEWRCERCGDMPARDARSDIWGAWPADGRDNPKAASRDAGCVQRRSTGRAGDAACIVYRASNILIHRHRGRGAARKANGSAVTSTVDLCTGTRAGTPLCGSTVAEEGQVKNQESGHKRKCRDAEFSAVAPGGLMGAYFNYCPTAYLRLSHLSLENT
ncbi:hypothetical protein AcV7_008752 [Taiwanofungus camphoratus]|nr:hypothetical protein AcV7_008752 [Antrodia cinnamomea]